MPRKSSKGPRIDMHTHVALPEVLELARRVKVRGSGPGKQNWIPAGSSREHDRQAKAVAKKLVEPKARLKDMDAMRVDIQVVSMNLPTPAYWADGATGRRIARACNEGIADFVAKVPDRFIGIGAVPLQDVNRSVRELKYAVNELGLRGVTIPSNIRTRDLGEPRFRKFWAKAEELDVPVFIHPRGFTHDDRLRKYFLWNTVGQPLEEALVMASLVYEGVMDDYPNLKVVVAHGGGYLPYYPGRGDKAFDSRPETRANIDRKPSDYLKRFYFDSVIFDREMLRTLVKRAGDTHVMMGTDYPRGEIETDPVGFVSRTSGLSASSKERIMSGNAAKLFGIELT